MSKPDLATRLRQHEFDIASRAAKAADFGDPKPAICRDLLDAADALSALSETEFSMGDAHPCDISRHARLEALEEAAKLCDLGAGYVTLGGALGEYGRGILTDTAASIRRLKEAR